MGHALGATWADATLYGKFATGHFSQCLRITGHSSRLIVFEAVYGNGSWVNSIIVKAAMRIRSRRQPQ